MAESFISTQGYLDDINELLVSAENAGAYCLGMISAMAEAQHLGRPGRGVLELVSKCRHIEEAVAVFEQWSKLEKRGAANAQQPAQ